MAVKRPPQAVGRFHPAVLSAHELVRPRLLLRLTADNVLGAAHCTLIVGPAGFGKTTLLAQAFRQLQGQAHPIIWLECNQHDADPSHLLNSLYTAADAAGANTMDPEFSTADFARRAADLGSDVCLCIDAMEHVIATDAEALIERLLNALPARARVLLASRSLLNAWFLERELQGLAVTIEAADLRLNCSELAELLPDRFTDEQIARVATLTEGWPVAAQLTRLRARDSSSIEEMLERLAHEGLGLFEYLAHKVLEGLSAEQRDFLRVTSILASITPALANTLMQRDDGYALMSGVLRLAPIVGVTSDREFTIRLHPLLRQYMRSELAREGHARERGLHRLAARAHARFGQIQDAIQHALLADDLQLAVDEFDQAGGDELIFTLGPRQVQTLAETLPQTARPFSLRLRFTDFVLALVNGRAHLVAELVQALLRALEAEESQPADPCTLSDPGPPWRQFAAAYAPASAELLADLHEGVGPGLFERCAAVERLARVHFPRSEAYLGLILAIEVLLFLRHASTAEVRRALHEYVALCERNHFAPHLPSVNPQRGWLAFIEGDLDAALGYLARPQTRRADRFAEPELLLAQLSKVLVATIHYERNEIEQAHAIIDGVFVDPDRTMPETWALTCRTRVLCLEALGRTSEADHVLELEQNQAKRHAARRLGLMLQALYLELDMRRQCCRVAAGLDPLTDALRGELAKPTPSWLLTSALGRAVIPALSLSGHHEAARHLASALVERAHACGHQLLHAAGQILLALALDASGDTNAARIQLAAALKVTGPMRVVRPYLDVWAGKATSPLVRIIAEQTSADGVEHIRYLLRALDTAAPHALDGWSTLSERERDVLSALSAHNTTKAIARTLGLSPETVKHHLKRIFCKLGVHSRTEALERLAQLSD